MIALIAEGQTDLLIIETILQKIISKDVAINYRFPDPEKREPGGWGNVFQLLSSSELVQLFYTNNWIIVHLDSDVFLGTGVPQKYQGRIRSDYPVEDIVAAISDIIVEEIGNDVYEQYKDKIIFAIAVHEIECWLLPFLYRHTQDSKKGKTTGCLNAVNRSQLLVQIGKTIDKNHKDLGIYRQILTKDFRRQAAICKKNPSAGIFISSIEENEELLRDFRE